jgi:hypothetical protein
MIHHHYSRVVLAVRKRAGKNSLPIKAANPFSRRQIIWLKNKEKYSIAAILCRYIPVNRC